MSKNLFRYIPTSDRFLWYHKSKLWYQKSFCDNKMIAPINNLINAHALNFVSAGIGKTLAFFFFFWHGSHHFINWKFYIFWFHKSNFVISQNPPVFSIPRNQFYDIKKSNLWHQKIDFLQNCFWISHNFDITKSIFDITKSSLFCDITKSILWYKKSILWYHKIGVL